MICPDSKLDSTLCGCLTCRINREPLAPATGSASPVTDDAWDAYNRNAYGMHYIAHKMRSMETALRSAAECIESNKRHLESMGRNATVGTGEVMDEIANVLRQPNREMSHGGDK